MVEERTTDGVRIAQLLASELVGDRDRLAAVTVTDADPDVEPTPDGAPAYRVRVADEGSRADDGIADRDRDSDRDSDGDSDPERGSTLAEVAVQPDRARVEFRIAPAAAAEAAEAAGLRVRPKAVTPPRTLVFLADGASVKRVLPAFEAVVREREA
ncbi:hypothetical protein Hbl1158_05825 [Halobaculum sp. CBA1158]|uniref:hypothetical protein n=1 Tax=Halobaculum sp. CBA1158 TaxID=2904243 RepID=UPI001F170082|nr:hypothetical protein [Halobaculum sp. CBA1158]UIP00874.1 hypothetical protein Hbl1158_05825 [Halobaculum sp. CBA1158]